MNRKNQRRVKILKLSPEFILGMLSLNSLSVETGCRTLYIPSIKGLPSDAEFLGIHYKFCMDCFEVLVFHESFDIVPEGDIPEKLEFEFKLIKKWIGENAEQIEVSATSNGNSLSCQAGQDPAE